MQKISHFFILLLLVSSFSQCHKSKETLPTPAPAPEEPTSEIISDDLKLLIVPRPEGLDTDCHLKFKDKVIYDHYCGAQQDKVVYFEKGLEEYDDEKDIDLKTPDVLILNRYDSDGCTPGEHVLFVFYESGDYFTGVIGNCKAINGISRDMKKLTIHFPSGPVGAGSIASAQTYIFDYKTKKLTLR